MKKIYTYTIFVATFLLVYTIKFNIPAHSKQVKTEASEGMEEDIEARTNWENNLLADPSTGKIPYRIRENELAFAATLPNDKASYKTGLGGNPWQNIGPWNVGGRTRVVVIDAIDENILYSGGVTGGIWKSTDGGVNWERKTTPAQMPAITTISQNPKHPDTLYAGTGEGSGSSASDGGAYYLGNGMYKSTDRGETWTAITRTASNSPQVFDRNWDITWKVVAYPSDTGDVFFAATYGSIYKSNNGGKGVTQVKGGSGPFGGGQSYYTDINVSSKGVLYATLSGEGYESGIWRCADAVNWKKITPVNFHKDYNRIVSGISPSNENIVYFLINNDSSGRKSINFRGDAEYNSLWKYTYTGDTTSPTLGNWEDLTQNLPNKGGQFGQFFTQNSYDMCVEIKPDDPNIIIIGGTNLWRSNDGFKTPSNVEWIGGYGVNTTLPDFKMYPNHHPDNHWAKFYKSNTLKMLSTCDGGIFRTDNIMSNNVTWTPLNNGYITTQYYSVALDHAIGGTTVLGGLQDNGTHWSNDFANSKFNWTMPFSGDGSHCYIPNGANELYVSKQEGKIYKIKVDAQGNPTHYVRIDPLSAIKKYQFINPFAIDPNNENRMYLPDGDRIYRNNDLSQYLYKTILDSVSTDLGWTEITNTTDSLQTITAVSVSKCQTDVMYYGTSNGKLYIVRNASVGQPLVQNISGTNFPAGNINCISLHPTDTNYIMAVFTNYNIKSIFYTKNGGQSWIDVSGNLEQFADGSGNGPSCRWAAVMPMNGFDGYFVATSTGLYSTDTLKGNQTKWVLQGAENIGNYVCTMIDTRPADGLVMVATHGAGVFAAKITERFQVLGEKPNEQNAHLKFDIYPNPTAEKAYIHLYTFKPEKLQIKIYNLNGALIKTVEHQCSMPGENELTIETSQLKTGMYLVSIETQTNTYIKKLQVIK